MKTYRQVQCSDRLPEKPNWYILINNETGSYHIFTFNGAEFNNLEPDNPGAYSWLEETQLPTEEEIEQYISDNKAKIESPVSIFIDTGFRAGARWILSKLK